MQLRQAEPMDAGTIADFNVRLAEETESLQLDPATVLKGVETLLRDPGKGVYYVAIVDGALAGQVMITYEWSDWRNGMIWWLQSVYVRQEYRRRGVFRKLFAHVSQLARQSKDACTIRLYMHHDNTRAGRTYKDLGMAETGYVVLELELSKLEAAAV